MTEDYLPPKRNLGRSVSGSSSSLVCTRPRTGIGRRAESCRAHRVVGATEGSTRRVQIDSVTIDCLTPF
jgi:hypothetical protein